MPSQVAELARGLVNFRDLGGLPTETGGLTRPGVLYRSDGPQRDDSPPADAVVWPPALVLDLRKPKEANENPLGAAGARISNYPLMVRKDDYWDVKDWSSMPDLDEIYQEFLGTAAAHLPGILTDVTLANGPALVHCAAGKDRTGVLVAILLRLVGVTREAVVADYHATRNNIAEVIIRLDLDYSDLEDADRERAEELIGTSDKAITDVLDVVDRAPDGPAGWAAAHGVAPATLEDWRKRLVG